MLLFALRMIGLLGIILCLYIHKKKMVPNQPFVCPLKGKCHEVVHSQYSTLFGISLEWIGFLYYGLVFVQMPALHAFEPWMKWISVLACAFSFYLWFLQAFVLKKMCTWCLVSFGLCICLILLLFFA